MSKLSETLSHIQRRSAMWFGRPGSIHDISVFITGFQCGQSFPPDTLSFEYFTRWVAAHYRVNDGAFNSFALILEHVSGDEKLAFDEFFRLLPLYERDMIEKGGEGVHAHYMKTMEEIRDNA